MRFKILPILLFFLFALVVAKVFDLGLEKGSPNNIRSDMQAIAQGKDADTKGDKPEQKSPEKEPAKDAVATPNEEEEAAKTADQAPAKDTGIENKDGVPQKNPPKNVEISDQVPMEKALLENLAKRRVELDDWANSIAMKESVLNATEKKINSKMEELKKLETEVSALLGQYKIKEDAKNKQLVKIYEGMKPAEAARIFDTIDFGILIEIVGGMSEASSSKIIAKMNPNKAKDLTTKLAEQKRMAAK